MPRNYVDNAMNRSLGRVGMPVGSMPVSRGSSGSWGSSYGGSFSGSSSGCGSSPKTYVDNAYNRSLGRVGMEHGTAVVSKSASSSYESPKTYVDNSYNRSLGRVGMEHGTAVVSKSASSSYESPKTYVDNSYNRSLGRVGMEHGTAVVSKSASSSSGSPKTYVDNAYNRSLGRVGMEHGTAVVSRSSSASSRSSASSGDSPKVYVDNDFNRKVGRVGLPHGAAVVSKDSIMTSSGEQRVYKDNAFNRRVGRVGLPIGAMVISRSEQLPKRTQQPSKENQRKSLQTKIANYIFKCYRDVPYEDVDLSQWEKDVTDPCLLDEASEQAMDLINRFKEVKLWQKESKSTKQPATSDELLDTYRGDKINFEDLDLKNKIGHGGFGDVFLAKWDETVVAVKKLRVQRVSKKRLQDFITEINIYCTLEHPNIVRFIGACCVTPNIAIVMEYMQGSLFDSLHMTEDSLPEEEKVSIIIHIARGMNYLHMKKIAHCDIKSQNVLLDSVDGKGYVAKITDFGLSLMKNSSETSSTYGDGVRNIGTPRYSAPEVLRGDVLNRTQMMMADMWSLGLVVFEIVSEEEPFDCFNRMQLVRHVGQGNEIPKFETGVNPILVENVSNCWNREASARPSALSFVEALEKLEYIYN